MNITFYGAAREVTGSCSLLETEGQKFLIDCGMFQGGEFNEKKNHDPLPFDPEEISAVFVTHAHLDHVGRLPLLAKKGFSGHIFATPATIKLAELILFDAVEVMESNKRHFGTPLLFEASDIASVMSLFKAVDYHEEKVLNLKNGTLGFVFYDAGHIFGSAFIEIKTESKKVVFSGDIGNIDVPIVRDTEMISSDVDALICESTYGDRLHDTSVPRGQLLEHNIKEAITRGGVLMIPSFSVERTQELLYELNDLIDRKKQLPRVPIFLDSPLAIGATEVFRQFPQYYDEDADKLLKDGDDLFKFPGLSLCKTREESKRINQVPGSKIIIAGAGMMNGGRIVHHALRYLSDPKNTLLIIGYQAQGTLGRHILDGDSSVKIFEEIVSVRCEVKFVGSLSSHGDREKLLNWIGGGTSIPKKVYMNHGDPEQSEALAGRLTGDLGVKATVVNFGLKVEV